MRACWFVALAASVALWPSVAAAAPPVKVDGGLVQGVADGELSVYKGIPFAAPPIGDLRWKKPQPVVAWPGTRAADAYAPACVQSMASPPPSGTSEDCLYLNVWTPATSAANDCRSWCGSTAAASRRRDARTRVHDGARSRSKASSS